jgi:hypothetical protein
MFVLLSSRFCCFLYFRKGEEEFSGGRLSSPLLFCTPEKRRKQTQREERKVEERSVTALAILKMNSIVGLFCTGRQLS